jgi:hypothetical protein
MRKPVRPLLVMWVLSLVLIFLALGTVGGGILLIQDPTGAVMQLEISWLVNTPFVNYFVPGLILLLLYGVGSLFLLYALWELPKFPLLTRLTRFTHEHWAWDFTVLLGVFLLVWLVVQFVVLPATSPIQPVMLVVALALIVLPLLPGMRRFYAR